LAIKPSPALLEGLSGAAAVDWLPWAESRWVLLPYPCAKAVPQVNAAMAIKAGIFMSVPLQKNR
jgi:hypothetical protein